MRSVHRQVSLNFSLQSIKMISPQEKQNDHSQETVSINMIQDEQVQVNILRANVIRSNKMIIRHNLRNSLQIPKTISFLNSNEDKLTASSIKQIEEDDVNKKKQQIKSQKLCKLLGLSNFSISEPQQQLDQHFDSKYICLQKIGQGAHSVVYKCQNKQTQKFYALKKIKNISFENWQNLKNSLRMMKNLNHSNLLQYEQFFFDIQKKTTYIVMEYCQNHDLRYEISSRSLTGVKFTPSQITKICSQITNVLSYLHQQGICHRDLKPENILYNKQTSEIKVIDLDVCGVKTHKSHNFDLWTNTGTLFYRAPQTFGIGYTQKADIWSLGIILFELISGKTPFQTQYQKDFLNIINYTQIQYCKLQASKKNIQILKLCLQKDTKQRASATKLNELINCVVKDDDFMIKFLPHENNEIKSYDCSEKDRICLGNLLKFNSY